jgi:hypothetical protein
VLVKTVLLLTISSVTETLKAEEKIERAKQLIEKKRKEKEEEEKQVRIRLLHSQMMQVRKSDEEKLNKTFTDFYPRKYIPPALHEYFSSLKVQVLWRSIL